MTQTCPERHLQKPETSRDPMPASNTACWDHQIPGLIPCGCSTPLPAAGASCESQDTLLQVAQTADHTHHPIPPHPIRNSISTAKKGQEPAEQQMCCISRVQLPAVLQPHSSQKVRRDKTLPGAQHRAREVYLYLQQRLGV